MITIKMGNPSSGEDYKRRRYSKKGSTYIQMSKKCQEIIEFNRYTIYIKNSKIFIRRGSIDDSKTKKIQSSFGLSDKFQEYIGEYYIEKEEEGQDEFELIKIEE